MNVGHVTIEVDPRGHLAVVAAEGIGPDCADGHRRAAPDAWRAAVHAGVILNVALLVAAETTRPAFREMADTLDWGAMR